MKIANLSSLLLLVFLFIGAFIPEANARCYRRGPSFGFSVNVGGPAYVVAPPAPVFVAAPAYAYPAYAAPAPYPYPAPAYVSGPVYYGAPQVYAQPGFSYSYRRY